MKYLYTTEPDDKCHEIEPGIYGRPAHTTEQASLKEKGWTTNINDLKGDDHVRKEKEGRKEEGEVDIDLEYERVLGKKPHHLMKDETKHKHIAEALSND